MDFSNSVRKEIIFINLSDYFLAYEIGNTDLVYWDLSTLAPPTSTTVNIAE